MISVRYENLTMKSWTYNSTVDLPCPHRVPVVTELYRRFVKDCSFVWFTLNGVK